MSENTEPFCANPACILHWRAVKREVVSAKWVEFDPVKTVGYGNPEQKIEYKEAFISRHLLIRYDDKQYFPHCQNTAITMAGTMESHFKLCDICHAAAAMMHGDL